MRGFTLLEVLIAMVVLSVGLLGLAGLQATSLKNNHDAYLRTIATLQAYDMADRMRANIQGVNLGLYNDISGTSTAPDCNTDCDANAIAALDSSRWNRANEELLPVGTGTVTGAGANSIFTVTVEWTEFDDEPASFAMTLRP